MSMERVTVDGHTLNKRTADMLALWQFNCLTDFLVVQGSYNRGGVAQSAGTHDGGGALDISVFGWADSFKKKVVLEGRKVGFAVWWRHTIPGLWNEHIHGIAIGDPEASAGARQQVSEYRSGGDGLKGSAKDPDPRPRSIPTWPNVRITKSVNLLTVYRQFKAKKPVARTSVQRVQWVLNEKLGTHLICDGVAGPQTRAAYKKWEEKVKAPAADGVPGRFSLNQLGKCRFNVSAASYEKWAEAQLADKKIQSQREKILPTFKK